MLINNALDPAKDLLPILSYFQRTLISMQAPSRTAATEQWMTELHQSFFKTGTTGSSESKSLDEIAELLPPFFERAVKCIEEIQRDVSDQNFDSFTKYYYLFTTDGKLLRLSFVTSFR